MVEQLQRFFGARRSMVLALLLCDSMLDKDNRSAGVHGGVHELARDARFSEDILRTSDEGGSIPTAVRDAHYPVTDRNNTVSKAR